jgi:hypothetical protein
MTKYQGCGSRSGINPDSMAFVDPDFWESGSWIRGQSNEEKKCTGTF